MSKVLLRFEGKRLSLDIGEAVRIRGARVGLCVGGEWLFPLERGADSCRTPNWHDPIGVGEHYRFSATDEARRIACDWHAVIYEAGDLARVWMEISNVSGKPVRLDGLHLMETATADGGCFHLGRPLEREGIFTDSGSAHFAGVSPLLGESPSYGEKWNHFCPPATLERMLELTGERPLGAGDHASYSSVAVLAGVHDAGDALLLGYAPVQRAMGAIICRATSSSGIEFLVAACGFFGYALASGESMRSEDLLVGCAPDGHAALRRYAEVSARLRGITIKRDPEQAPSGWMSWYAFRTDANEQNVLANARVVAERFLPYGMDVIQLDYGWQKDFVCNEWRETSENYPHGLSRLAHELQRLGLRMGLWVCPVGLSSCSRLFATHPEYALKDQDGQPIRIGNWTWGQREPMYVIDPTVPGALDDAAEAITQLRGSTGSRFWKVDFMLYLLQMGFRPRFADPSQVPGIETYRAAAKAIRKAAGDDYVYFSSNFPYAEWGIGDTGGCPDIGNPCLSKTHRADNRNYDGDEFRRNATTILSRYFLHRRLTLVCPDAANLGPEADLNEARLRFSLVAFSGGQFLLGDDLTRYPEERLALAEKGVPVYGQSATPVDMFERPYPSFPSVWKLPVQTRWDSWYVFCLANMSEEADLHVDLLPLLEDPDKAVIFDLWGERILDLPDHSRVTLEPTESRILSVRKLRETPHLLATSLHYTCGGVEVTDHTWDQTSSTLKVSLQRRPGARGAVWVHAPAGFAFGSARSEGASLKEKPQSERITRIDVEFAERVARLTVRFRRTD